jgi:hypothetical protein
VGKVQHGLEGGLPVLGAGLGAVFGHVRGVQGDGDTVKSAYKVWDDISPAYEAAVAVGVHPNGGKANSLLPQPVADPEDIVHAIARLPKTAEDQLAKLGEIPREDILQGLLPGRLPGEPKVVVKDGLAAVLADAKDAGAVTAVGEVDVEAVAIFIGHCHV